MEKSCWLAGTPSNQKANFLLGRQLAQKCAFLEMLVLLSFSKTLQLCYSLDALGGVAAWLFLRTYHEREKHTLRAAVWQEVTLRMMARCIRTIRHTSPVPCLEVPHLEARPLDC